MGPIGPQFGPQGGPFDPMGGRPVGRGGRRNYGDAMRPPNWDNDNMYM